MDAEQPAVSSSVSEPESKRVARLAQLSSARDSAANKKRQRDVDIAEIKDSIKLIDQKLSTEETPKRQRVITKQDETPEPESWTTTMIRTTAVLGLASASYWFQHRYGKPLAIIKKKIETKQAPAPLLHVPDRDKPLLKNIGASGFVQ
jgi:hypothetical protein